MPLSQAKTGAGISLGWRGGRVSSLRLMSGYTERIPEKTRFSSESLHFSDVCWPHPSLN